MEARGRSSVGAGRIGAGRATKRAGLVLVLGATLVACATEAPADSEGPGEAVGTIAAPAEGAEAAQVTAELAASVVTPAPPHVDPSAIRSLLLPEAGVVTGIPAIQGNVMTTLRDEPRVPPANTQSPANCDIAAILSGLGTSGYALQDTLSPGGRLQQEVHLFADAAAADAAYAIVQDRASSCPSVTIDYVEAGDPISVEVSGTADTTGTFPSLAQDTRLSADAYWVTEGYNGYVLVGNAIVHWSADAPNYHAEQMPRVDRAVLGTRSAVEAVVLAHLQQFATS
ncbi:hypothetical protein [Oerskovia merdavium]|uniref:Sensor domain-containing protein n=1 Tax=Oerskovia merdavium TaxID=2762227 RepID=A0ABR8U052_9CELL|nr:hypothetical protein [Oerskovia merdavium]MBD7981120.1 hypothetical protein [Oerskovia merdavium]